MGSVGCATAVWIVDDVGLPSVLSLQPRLFSGFGGTILRSEGLRGGCLEALF